MSQVLGALGCWISPCYGLISLGARFEIYEPFISLIGESRMLNRWIRGHDCIF
jgi:hypothetical protein